MAQRYDHDTAVKVGGSEAKTSGVYPRARADEGWGFVLPDPDGTFRIARAVQAGTIGSGEKAATRLEGADVSPEHARIEVRADGVYLEDVGSTGGTFVGGVRARRIGVTHGDVVRFGRRLAVFVERGLATHEGSADLGAALVVGPHGRKAWVEPVLEAVRAGRSVALEGGPGTGKRTLAELAAREREGIGPVVTVDGAKTRPDAIAQARAQRPATWVVLHADQLPRPAQIEIAQALGRTPGAIAIATITTPLDRALADGLVAPAFASMFAGRRVVVPSLDARREDVPALVGVLAKRAGIPIGRIEVELLEAFARAGWPGGVTELEHVLREAAGATEGPLSVAALPRSLTRPALPTPAPPASDDPALARARLTDALQRANGSIASAARTLGMSRQAVYREAQRLGLDVGKRRGVR
jgi:hypothetical protein